MKRFYDREEYLTFLREKFKNLREEYNVFTHIITIFSHDRFEYFRKSELEILDSKTFGILERGLALNLNPAYRYSSMNGTTCYAGNSTSLDVNGIVDYTYDQANVPIRRVIVFAVPKYIDIDGKRVEFSSYKGATSYRTCPTPEIEREIKNAYEKHNVFDRGNQNTKFSLLDCTLSDYIPKQYILGCQQVNTENGEYSFLENELHISRMSEEERKIFDRTKVDAILGLGFNPSEDNRLDVFAKKTKKDGDILDALYFEDV